MATILFAEEGETGELHYNTKILYCGCIILEYISLGLMLVEIRDRIILKTILEKLDFFSELL